MNACEGDVVHGTKGVTPSEGLQKSPEAKATVMARAEDQLQKVLEKFALVHPVGGAAG
ncbi:hypothetical protein [Novosphingobium sp. PY1]|uniref:hypothetical protein n=1 Tax=Novosphingobium sp. PY1 TaxID=1882221 RepID=UPI000BE789C6|nr:hypothetical protein [Novosphingobium sp. PY1]BBA74020.1 N-6 DNA Methylase [Novosphingobium sp. PY1]GFM31257.1 N-6 DNA methylase [Novosphingobium sp. PY1]